MKMSEAERIQPTHCCYIDPTTKESCRDRAEWQIKNATPGADPYDYTDACTRHVGDLLTEGADHSVYPIDSA